MCNVFVANLFKGRKRKMSRSLPKSVCDTNVLITSKVVFTVYNYKGLNNTVKLSKPQKIFIF